jgi:hypothetical protein
LYITYNCAEATEISPVVGGVAVKASPVCLLLSCSSAHQAVSGSPLRLLLAKVITEVHLLYSYLMWITVGKKNPA